MQKFTRKNAAREFCLADREGPLEIVIVDDCPTVRDALATILEGEGYAVRTFTTGEDFVQNAPRLAPACVLLDVGMQSLSGLDVLGAIGGADYRAPVIVMTGIADDGLRPAAMAAGACGFVEKPFDAEVLLRRIREALDRQPGSA